MTSCALAVRSAEEVIAKALAVLRERTPSLLLRAGIDGQAGGMGLVTIHPQCAGGRFNFDLLAGLIHVDVGVEHAGDQQAAENENNESAADDGENPEDCVIASRRRWLRRERRAAGRNDWCG